MTNEDKILLKSNRNKNEIKAAFSNSQKLKKQKNAKKD